MDPSYPGAQHNPSTIDRGILSDIGWDVVGVPEPSSLSLFGMGTVFLLRRRRAA